MIQTLEAPYDHLRIYCDSEWERTKRINADWAWAAGLFDGEGSTYIKWSKAHKPYGKRYYKYPCMVVSITQIDNPEVLHRFCEIVGGKKVHGPYLLRGKRRMWQYRTNELALAQHIVSHMWPWLSLVKKTQALLAFQEYWNYPRGPSRLRTHCKNGHELTPENIYLYKNERGNVRVCRICQRQHYLRYKERKRLAS